MNWAIRLLGPPDESYVGALRRAGSVDPTRLDPEYAKRPPRSVCAAAKSAPSRSRRRRGLEPIADLLGELARHKGPEAVKALPFGLPSDREPTHDELLQAASTLPFARFQVGD